MVTENIKKWHALCFIRFELFTNRDVNVLWEG